MKYTCKIVRVIDGDTVMVDISLGFGVTLNEVLIRIKGIDAPEIHSTDVNAKKQGYLCKSKVESTLLVRSLLITDEVRDKYGRILGDFETDSGLLSEYLIKNNYAVSYNGENKDTVTASHLKNREILVERKELC